MRALAEKAVQKYEKAVAGGSMLLNSIATDQEWSWAAGEELQGRAQAQFDAVTDIVNKSSFLKEFTNGTLAQVLKDCKHETWERGMQELTGTLDDAVNDLDGMIMRVNMCTGCA